MSVTSSALSENLAGADIESGTQRDGTVAGMIMGNSFHVSQTHGQKGVAYGPGLESGSSRLHIKPWTYQVD